MQSAYRAGNGCCAELIGQITGIDCPEKGKGWHPLKGFNNRKKWFVRKMWSPKPTTKNLNDFQNQSEKKKTRYVTLLKKKKNQAERS